MKKSLWIMVMLVIVGGGYWFFLREKEPVQTSSEAVALVQKQVPELASYPSENLPVKSIETKDTDTGWLLGFYTEGSGVKGILDAKCYAVSKEGEVTETGSYQADNTPPAEKIELSNCTPTNVAPAQPLSTSVSTKKWMWTQSVYNDGRTKVMPKKNAFTLTLLDNGTFTITTDCNSGGGKYVKTDSVITFTDIVRTEMACGNSQESDFVKMLQDAKGYHFGMGGGLILDLKTNGGVMVFQ